MKLYRITPLQIAWVQVVLVDPQGSGLYNKVTRGVMYAREEAENTRLRNPCDTITEGVGVNRVTANFEQVLDGLEDAWLGLGMRQVKVAWLVRGMQHELAAIMDLDGAAVDVRLHAVR